MAAPKKSWFEKHQGLINFLGYSATVLIGGFSLYYSNSKATTALELTNNQFKYEIKKDSLNRIDIAKSDSESKVKFLHQDSLNKHQDSINSEQLKNFKSQTLTGREQLSYFKKQTSIAETQLKNAEIIYQQQIDENKPNFLSQDFSIDYTVNKANLSMRFNFTNSGKRVANIKKLMIVMWNLENDFLDLDIIPVDGGPMQPTAQSDVLCPINKKLGLNRKTLILIQFFYTDKLAKGTLTNREFIRFVKYGKPGVVAQIEEPLQRGFLSRIHDREIIDKTKYLTF